MLTRRRQDTTKCCLERKALLENYSLLTRAFCITCVILRKDGNIPYIPCWTGFFIDLNKNLTVKPSNIGYLDCLDAPATEMSTIYFMMERSLRIKDQLQLKLIVCLYNQAIYAKVHQIKGKEPAKFKDIFLMMSTFHIILTVLAVIAIRFRDAGLRDTAVQSNIVAEGSVDTMFSGTRAYKHAIRVYKIICKAFSRILLKDFEDAHPDTTSTMRQYAEDVTEDSDLNFMSESDEMSQYCNNFVTFKEKLCTTCNLVKFWISFLDMIELLFNWYTQHDLATGIFTQNLFEAHFHGFLRMTERITVTTLQFITRISYPWKKNFWKSMLNSKEATFRYKLPTPTHLDELGQIKSLKQLSMEIQRHQVEQLVS